MAIKQMKCWVPALAGTIVLLMTLTNAQAFESIKMGDWDIDISGNINGFFTNVDCDPNGNGAVAGGLACGSNGTNRTVGSIQTGLLPSWFGFHAKQETDGLTTEINIGFQPGIDGAPSRTSSTALCRTTRKTYGRSMSSSVATGARL
ncbi:MAG: hypothetical protein IIA78_06995 [Proteobacteria bacterium]|nr:hypothetical protein [Pseudomonadota bacterium]